MPTHFYTDPGVYEVLFIWEGTCELDTISLEVEIGSLEFDYEVFSPDSVNCTEENPQIVLDLETRTLARSKASTWRCRCHSQ